MRSSPRLTQPHRLPWEMLWSTHQAVLVTNTSNQQAVVLWVFLSLYKSGQGHIEFSPSPFSSTPPTSLSKPCTSLCPFPEAMTPSRFHSADPALLTGAQDSKVPETFLMPIKMKKKRKASPLPRSVSKTPAGLALLPVPGLLTTEAAVSHFPLLKPLVKSRSLLPKSSKTDSEMFHEACEGCLSPGCPSLGRS